MDERELQQLIKRCGNLKFKFKGVFAADNFPPLGKNTCQIVNASEASSRGTHWTLICNRSNDIIFADPLGINLSFYQKIYRRMLTLYAKVTEILPGNPIQPVNSNDCGLYCIYIAHCIFSKMFPKVPQISQDALHRFVKHMQ